MGHSPALLQGQLAHVIKAPNITRAILNIRTILVSALLALAFGFIGAAGWSYSGLADDRTRAFLLENPEMLPQMAEELQAREASRRLADAGKEVFTPFPGAVLGNPDGSRVLVEFTDYNCPYCEASLADVEKLISADPELKVIVREWPIFEGSEGAARMALAAAAQGRYRAFHEEMFKLGPATPETVEAAALASGLDMEKARKDAASDQVSLELARNQSLARSIGFNGTPAWVTGDKALSGAVGFETLEEAIANAQG